MENGQRRVNYQSSSYHWGTVTNASEGGRMWAAGWNLIPHQASRCALSGLWRLAAASWARVN